MFKTLLFGVAAGFKRDYDWSRDVAAIKAPTLIVAGDADAVWNGWSEPGRMRQLF